MTASAKDIMYMLSEIGTLEAVVLRDEIGRLGNEEQYRENTETLAQHLEFAIVNWRNEHTENVVQHNEMIAKSIRWFVQNGIWVNLSQLYRALQSDIIEAVEVSMKFNKVKSQSVKDTIVGSIEVDKAFHDVSLKDRRLALELLTQYKKEHPDEKDNG
jgi:hypothetical protein